MPIAKEFADALNRNLEELDAPSNPRERAIILSKMFNIPKQLAWSLLEGQMLPDDALLQKISEEFEI